VARLSGAVVVVAGVAAAVLSGCGSDSEAAPAPGAGAAPAGSADPAAQPAPDPCSLLTNAEVSHALSGTDTTATPSGESCLWEDSGHRQWLAVSYQPQQGHAVELMLTKPELAPPGGRPLDIGDGAIQFPGTNKVAIRVGEDYLSVGPGAGGPPMRADVLATLAKLACARAH
jgi:hypothetical protein